MNDVISIVNFDEGYISSKYKSSSQPSFDIERHHWRRTKLSLSSTARVYFNIIVHAITAMRFTWKLTCIKYLLLLSLWNVCQWFWNHIIITEAKITELILSRLREEASTNNTMGECKVHRFEDGK